MRAQLYYVFLIFPCSTLNPSAATAGTRILNRYEPRVTRNCSETPRAIPGDCAGGGGEDGYLGVFRVVGFVGCGVQQRGGRDSADWSRSARGVYPRKAPGVTWLLCAVKFHFCGAY